jgi:hypothetical protein
VKNFDPAVVAAVLFEFGFDLGRVAHEVKLIDARVFPQREHGSAHNVRRAEIAAHGIESDFHRSTILRTSGRECKIKIVER